MLTLGIETSGTSGSVALVEAGEVLGETELSLTGRRHARTLVAELKSLFDRVGRPASACECVAVSIGPGSFTGLRVGVVCAKTFAYAIGCRIVAVDTLAAIASGAPPDVAAVNVLIDAMRGDVFHGRYIRSADGWRRDGEIGLVAWRSLAAQPMVGTTLAGPALANIPGDQWPAPRLPAECWSPQARQVALIGEREAAAGRIADLWTIEPLYIRKSAAEEQAERLSPT
jgi:tRNA threonylcarbamoyladenosine biosynthesis protein TsaB